MLAGIYIDLIVPDKYVTVGAGTSTTFRVPMFDQGYTIDYSYSDVAYGDKSYSGLEFPKFSIAKNLSLISRYTLSWTGMSDAEKSELDDFIKSFNNSFQPFTLRLWLNQSGYDDYYMIIEPDTITLTKDKFNLWSATFTCIQLGSL